MKLIILLIIAAVVFVFYRYNNIIKLIEAVKNSKAAISVQLDSRGKIFDSMVETVKKMQSHELELFATIAKLRSSIADAKAEKDEGKERLLQDKLSEIVNGGGLKIAVEAYPELKSNETMLNLQESILSAENRLASAKSGFNHQLEKYKSTVKQIPDNFIVSFVPSLLIDEDYWTLTEEKIKVEEDRRVSFD